MSQDTLTHAYNTIILAAATRGQDFIGNRRANECQAILAGARVALACLPKMQGGRSGEAGQLAVMLEDGTALAEAVLLATDLRQAQRAGYDLDEAERLQKANDIAARVRAQQEFNKTVAAAVAGKPANPVPSRPGWSRVPSPFLFAKIVADLKRGPDNAPTGGLYIKTWVDRDNNVLAEEWRYPTETVRYVRSAEEG